MTQHGSPSLEQQDLFVDSGEIRLAVRDYGGAGQPVVLVHGGPGPNLTSWDELPPRLTGRFRAIVYDQRGHGRSDDAADYSYASLAGDIQAIVEALRLADPIVVGHSWGGWIAMAYAATSQECAGAVAVDGPLKETYKKHSDDDWARLEEQLRTNPVASRLIEFVGTSGELDELLGSIRATAPEHHPEFSEAAFRHELVVGADGLLRHRRSLDHFIALNRAVDDEEPPPIETYGRIICPVLLVGATGGPFGRDAVERAQARYPKLRTEWLECGHDILRERPDELAALITDFASSLARQ